jgi:cytochrome c-type biogenesis protein CcmF
VVQLGRFAVLLALATSLWSVFLAVTGVRMKRHEAVRSAEGGLRASAVALTVAAGALWWAFLTRDFSVQYVAEYSSRSLSTFYTLGAFWAGQGGSLLLWSWLTALFAVLVVRQNRFRNRDLMPYVVATLGAVLFLFTLLVAFAADPFQRLAFTPADGQGLNPMLQNYGQWVHPLALYGGFVGFTVPFAFAIAALLSARLDDRWIRAIRGWSLWSWVLLGAGLVLGARWAYVELGWGGYWAWDPVENAGLLPWLAATAYLHSIMIQEKRDALKVWNVSLVVATFALSLFGTFLTRSGIISSVHAFGASSIGTYLLIGVVVTVLVSGGLIVWRLPELRATGRIGAIVSRESSFLLNNVLLLAITVAVFWGTVFPMVSEATRGVELSVGQSFYEAVVTPLAVALLLLIGICPMLAWRRASWRNLQRSFKLPLAAGILTLAVALALTRGSHFALVLLASFAGFVVMTIAVEFARGTRARANAKGGSWPGALLRLFSANPRRYGGYLVHLGVVILVTGIAIHVAFRQETREAGLRVGESVVVGAYDLRLRAIDVEQTAAKFAVIADFDVRDPETGARTGGIRAERAMYENQDQPTSEVGIRSTPLADLYLILESADPEAGVVTVEAIVNPGVFWIWVGGILLLVGGVTAAWPRRAPRDELERVLAEAEAALAAANAGEEV